MMVVVGGGGGEKVDDGDRSQACCVDPMNVCQLVKYSWLHYLRGPHHDMALLKYGSYDCL